MAENRRFMPSWMTLRRATIASATLLTLVAAQTAAAQRFYDSLDEAGSDMLKAAQSDDERAILAILGRRGADIVSSGDPVADANLRKRFVEEYMAKHGIVMEGDDKAVLVIGADDFQFPIPLVRKAQKWQFDAAAGRREILARRIGRNELSTIQTCLAYVDAQQEYAEKAVAGPGVYAQRIVSRPGRKDGLYWSTEAGEPESPLGALAAQAAAGGYKAGSTRSRAPYHGYFFRILTRQGSSAPGGEADYTVRGKMVGGFALIAFPAAYGVSGIMTFMVNHDGKVYEKDLGRRTEREAAFIQAFNPDKTWRLVAPDATAAAAQ